MPDEITLCLNITGCPCHCEGCFEPWLAEDNGTVLTWAVLQGLIDSHPHITCVCFMGGDRYYSQIDILIQYAKREGYNLKWAMYSGETTMNPRLSHVLDYYKIGPFMPRFGPLNYPTTNQRFYKRIDNNWIDITYRFQEKKD